MACDAPVRECLGWHYAQHFANVKPRKDGRQIHARCPLCQARQGLVISAGQWQRTVWKCFAGCDGKALRKAIIAAGVPAACVPRGHGTETTQAEVLDVILTDTSTTHGTARLRALAVIRGHAHWPKGKDLEQLAQEAGISRGVAYDMK